MKAGFVSDCPGGLMTIPAQSWSYVTPGFGYRKERRRQVCYRLRITGYDRWFSIEHEDALSNSVEGLKKSAALPKGAVSVAPSDFKPQAI